MPNFDLTFIKEPLVTIISFIIILPFVSCFMNYIYQESGIYRDYYLYSIFLSDVTLRFIIYLHFWILKKFKMGIYYLTELFIIVFAMSVLRGIFPIVENRESIELIYPSILIMSLFYFFHTLIFIYLLKIVYIDHRHREYSFISFGSFAYILFSISFFVEY